MNLQTTAAAPPSNTQFKAKRTTVESIIWPNCSITLLLLLLVVAPVGCSTSPKNRSAELAAREEDARKVKAIEAVLKTLKDTEVRMEAEFKQISALELIRPGQPKAMAWVSKVKESLRNIDTKGCPQEFRNAYLEFVQATEDFFAETAPYRGWRGLKTSVLTPWKLLELDEMTAEAGKPLKAAEQKLERTAVALGATLPP